MPIAKISYGWSGHHPVDVAVARAQRGLVRADQYKRLVRRNLDPSLFAGREPELTSNLKRSVFVWSVVDGRTNAHAGDEIEYTGLGFLGERLGSRQLKRDEKATASS